ncbi:MAG: M48 family metallopeptidase [Methanomicrobiales archaeon]|nr:M48 family metallopeptidase [Methanomicrobiales archaeon]
MRRNGTGSRESSRAPDEILWWDNRIRVEVRREKRKGARLLFRADGTLCINAPEETDIRLVLRRRRRWLGRRMAELAESASEKGKCDDKLLLRGRWHLLKQSDVCRLPIDGEDEVCYSTPAALSDLLKRELRRDLERLTDHYGRRMDVRYNRIAIRKQRSRWGSCSSNRNLNFNLIMIALPTPLCEYVVIHEVAHLAERGHSGGFWKLVAQHCSDYEERERKLQQYWYLIEGNRVWQTLRESSRSSRERS